MRSVALTLLIALLGGCASHAPAPTSERTPTVLEKASGTPAASAPAPAATAPVDGPVHIVKKGDTLYSIALDNGKDYKDLAAWNLLENPNRIQVGQQLRLTPPRDAETGVVVKPIAGPAAVEVRPVTGPVAPRTAEANSSVLKREPKGGKVPYSEDALARARDGMAARPADAPVAPAAPVATPAVTPAAAAPAQPAAAIEWSWPTGGKLMAPFAEGSSKGIVISGTLGEAVFAAAPGKVVYVGSGLRGYGKLVVVRHDADFLSVYAHNSQVLVKEGDAITRRQKIAEVGSTDAESPRLHFEIRRQGKPVDPQKFLPLR